MTALPSEPLASAYDHQLARLAAVGIVIAMLHVPTTGGIEELSTEGVQPMTPGQAAKIDRKMDDGYPASGSVYAYGLMNSCFTSSSVLQYNESVTSYDCGLVFRIQK